MLAVLGLGALLAVLVYAFWGEISVFLGKPPEAEKTATESRRPVERRVEEPAAPAQPKPVERAPEPVAKRVEPRARPSVAARERETAREFSLRAEEALKALDFENARELYEKAASALRSDPSGSGKMKALATKAGTFRAVTKDATPNPAVTSTLVTLKLHTGNDIKDVALVDETATAYVIARRGMQFDVDKGRVSKVVRMSPEEQRERLLLEFEALETKARAREASGAGYFKLADRAFRDGLKENALKYLEKAYEMDGADLPKQLRIAEAKQLLGLAIWCDSTGRTRNAKIHCKNVVMNFSDLPDQVADARELLDKLTKPVAVADYKSTVRIDIKKRRSGSRDGDDVAAADEEATVVTQKVSSGSSVNDKLMAEINDVFDEAMDHYVKGRPGNPNSNQHLHKAAALFDKVIALCDKALKNDPGNSQIESRQADASRYAYHSRKMSTL